MLKLIFLILTGLIFYSYFGYTAILLVFSLFKKKKKYAHLNDKDLPEVTHVIAAFNEEDVIPDKINNCNTINYPKDKIVHLWITDGSDDGSLELLKNKDNIAVLHKDERKGKTAAINRAMRYVSTPITILSDANTQLSEMAIRNIIAPFSNPKIGCVAGEKRIRNIKKDKASGSGEGLYWNYESLIKKLESDFGSTVGAVGELYAIRTKLFNPPPEDTILDDFVVSMYIAKNGYKLHYQSNAYSVEESSSSIKDEMERKVRIAAGGFQVLFGGTGLLNFFKHPSLSFQYLSHKVLRWLFVPIGMIVLLLTNLILVLTESTLDFFALFLSLQVLFYLLALGGYIFANSKIRFKIFFMPYYLVMMNIAQIKGLVRFLKGSQKATWDKVKRNSF